MPLHAARRSRRRSCSLSEQTRLHEAPRERDVEDGAAVAGGVSAGAAGQAARSGPFAPRNVPAGRPGSPWTRTLPPSPPAAATLRRIRRNRRGGTDPCPRAGSCLAICRPPRGAAAGARAPRPPTPRPANQCPSGPAQRLAKRSPARRENGGALAASPAARWPGPSTTTCDRPMPPRCGSVLRSLCTVDCGAAMIRKAWPKSFDWES